MSSGMGRHGREDRTGARRVAASRLSERGLVMSPRSLLVFVVVVTVNGVVLS